MSYFKRILPAAIFCFAFFFLILVIRLALMAYDGQFPSDSVGMLKRVGAMLVLIVALSFGASASMEWSSARRKKKNKERD